MNFSITSPYIEPRKPVEAWAIVEDGQETIFFERMGVWHCCRLDRPGARLIHLREVES